MNEHDEDEEVCEACKWSSAEDPHTCDFVNDDCPENCQTDHYVDRGEVLVCDETGRRWRYCERCGWEGVGRYADDPVLVNGELLCDPYEHGYRHCDECGELYDEDEGAYDDDGYYCSDDCCPTRLGNEPGVETFRCSVCDSHNRHLNLLTEDYLCDHKALEAHNNGVPVEWASGNAVLRLVENLGRVA